MLKILAERAVGKRSDMIEDPQASNAKSSLKHQTRTATLNQAQELHIDIHSSHVLLASQAKSVKQQQTQPSAGHFYSYRGGGCRESLQCREAVSL